MIYYEGNDDPHKNTALKMERRGAARIVRRMAQLPRGAILLDPFAEQAVSREDRATATAKGLCAFDCSCRTSVASACPREFP